MEIGMGVHGEPGIKRGPLQPADEVARTLVDAIVADIDGRGSGEVALLVNGLGATAYLLVLDSLLLGLVLGLPAMVLGALGYFLARSSQGRIAESKGTIGGQGTATTGLAFGVAATAVGAVLTLVAIVLYLLAAFGKPPV